MEKTLKCDEAMTCERHRTALLNTYSPCTLAGWWCRLEGTYERGNGMSTEFCAVGPQTVCGHLARVVRGRRRAGTTGRKAAGHVSDGGSIVDAGAADADFAVDQAGQINVTPSVLGYVTNVADVAKVSFHDALHSMQPATISVSGGHGNEQHSGNLPLPSQPTPNTPPVPAHITKHTGMSGMDYSRSLEVCLTLKVCKTVQRQKGQLGQVLPSGRLTYRFSWLRNGGGRM